MWGAAGLTASAGIAGWVEMFLLRRSLEARIGDGGLSAGYIMKLWVVALLAAASAWVVRLVVPLADPVIVAIVVLAPYGVVYLVLTWALGLPEAKSVWSVVLRTRA
jgi:putative peptidoglycan lipid II flippase